MLRETFTHPHGFSMADETEEPRILTCPDCGTQIDVSDEEPLSAVLCPTCGAPSVVSMQIDHFELVDVLGRGGMGVVYRAQDTSLDRPVALKLLKTSEGATEEQIAQLATEAAITASINHPHVVKVYTTGMDRGRFYIAMELVDKGTLDHLIDLQGRVAESQVLEVGIQIAQGLRAAQQAGLIHRDVKPGNILFADAHTAKIVDFGLAIFAEDEASVRGEVWGTPYYVAPEKLDNKPEDFRSDIYSLGGTLFHALAGRPPFEAENASLVALKHLKSQAMSLQAFAPWVTGSTAFVINRTLNKDPDQRYQSYDELIEHLEYARTELLTAKPQAAKRVVLETEQEKKAMGWLVFAMIGLMIAAIIAAVVFRDRLFKAEPSPSAVAAATPSASEGRNPTGMFPAARAKLEEGDAAAAAEAFRQAAAQSKITPIQAAWANLLEGLAELAAGQRAQADAAFTKVAERDLLAGKGGNEKLAAFLHETARQMTGGSVIAPNSADGLNKANYEAIAPLLFGIKNWQLGNTDAAVALLRRFRQTTPGGSDAWIGELKPVATSMLEEFTSFEMAADRLKAASNPDEIRAAVESLKTVKGQLAPRAQELVAKSASQLAILDKERAQMLAEGGIPDGTYKLLNRRTGRALDVAGNSRENGAKIHQWEYTGATNQQWKLAAAGGGYYTLVGVDSGKALDVANSSKDEGVAVQQWDFNGSNAQRWKIEKTNAPWFRMVAECSGHALASAPGSTENGAAVIQTTVNNAEEQQWKIEAP